MVPDSQFKSFTIYHHLKVSKLDDSVVDQLRFSGKMRYQTEGGWWSSKKGKGSEGRWCVRELCGVEVHL